MMVDDGIDRDLLLQTFFAECREGLDQLEKALLAMEAAQDRDALDTAFRAAHTLKGNALSLGYAALAKLAHALEERLGRLRDRSGTAAVSLMLQAVDGLRGQVEAAAAGRELQSRDDLVSGLLAAEVPAPPQQLEPEAHAQATRTLRVEVRKLDRMLDLSGEIAIARGRLRGLAGDPARLREALDDLDRHCREMQEEILAARALPIGPFLEQQARTVRDAALVQGKQARLVVEGDDVQVDTSVLDALREPLMHLVRNALAHGIEAPALRQARGKDPSGTVLLRAHHEPGCVVLEVCDDGNGFDRERIAQKAREMGLVDDPAPLSDAQLFAVVFEPGFTTATAVDEVAGRGVGMDAVRHSVDKLRGSVSIASHAGQGTTITLRLPLTLAILDAFFVQAAGETWALPLETVSECIDAPSLPAGRFGMVPLRGEALPWLRLSDHFGRPGRSGREGMVVVTNGGRRAGVVVEKLDGEGQAVLKPLGPLMRGARGVAGAALLGTGAVALILDVPALFSVATERT
jgi:two-component system chemotaxis sensor kinase CheA